MMTHIRVCGVLVGDKVIIHEKKGGGGLWYDKYRGVYVEGGCC